LNHLKELGLDVQKAHKTALKLRAHSVQDVFVFTKKHHHCAHNLCLKLDASGHSNVLKN